MEPETRFELVTPSLPRRCSTPELLGRSLCVYSLFDAKELERETRLELATLSLEG
jgi:hypothetical protein